MKETKPMPIIKRVPRLLSEEEAVKLALKHLGHEGDVPEGQEYNADLLNEDKFGDGGPTWCVGFAAPRIPGVTMHDTVLFISAKTGKTKLLDY